MNRISLCLFVAITGLCSMSFDASAQELESIKLNPPDTSRGYPLMKTLAVRASATEWSDRDLSLQDLSDLMWAANGLSRPDENKTTASSALNAHGVDIYVFMRNGVFVYDYRNHELEPVLGGDFRSAAMMQRARRPGAMSDGSSSDRVAADASAAATQPAEAAIQIVLVSDPDRFRAGTADQKYEWGAIDTGIISQNISLFCAATGLKTRPRSLIDKEGIKDLLELKETQYVFLNHPVGYAR
jgi:hypothetical protein